MPVIVVSRQLGHANPQVTAQVYAHLLADDQLDLAAGALDALLGADTVREDAPQTEIRSLGNEKARMSGPFE